jgi:hypothetical protein
MNFIWTYLMGPILSLLPERWRRAPLWYERVQWERAGTVSGIVELFAAVTVLGYWYMYEMQRRIGQIMELADTGKLGPEVSEHQVQGAALTLFWMNPLTWLLLYFFWRGRFVCARQRSRRGRREAYRYGSPKGHGSRS